MRSNHSEDKIQQASFQAETKESTLTPETTIQNILELISHLCTHHPLKNLDTEIEIIKKMLDEHFINLLPDRDFEIIMNHSKLIIKTIKSIDKNFQSNLKKLYSYLHGVCAWAEALSKQPRTDILDDHYKQFIRFISSEDDEYSFFSKSGLEIRISDLKKLQSELKKNNSRYSKSHLDIIQKIMPLDNELIIATLRYRLTKAQYQIHTNTPIKLKKFSRKIQNIIDTLKLISSFTSNLKKSVEESSEKTGLEKVEQLLTTINEITIHARLFLNEVLLQQIVHCPKATDESDELDELELINYHNLIAISESLSAFSPVETALTLNCLGDSYIEFYKHTNAKSYLDKAKQYYKEAQTFFKISYLHLLSLKHIELLELNKKDPLAILSNESYIQDLFRILNSDIQIKENNKSPFYSNLLYCIPDTYLSMQCILLNISIDGINTGDKAFLQPVFNLAGHLIASTQILLFELHKLGMVIHERHDLMKKLSNTLALRANAAYKMGDKITLIKDFATLKALKIESEESLNKLAEEYKIGIVNVQVDKTQKKIRLNNNTKPLETKKHSEKQHSNTKRLAEENQRIKEQKRAQEKEKKQRQMEADYKAMMDNTKKNDLKYKNEAKDHLRDAKTAVAENDFRKAIAHYNSAFSRWSKVSDHGVNVELRIKKIDTAIACADCYLNEKIKETNKALKEIIRGFDIAEHLNPEMDGYAEKVIPKINTLNALKEKCKTLQGAETATKSDALAAAAKLSKSKTQCTASPKKLTSTDSAALSTFDINSLLTTEAKTQNEPKVIKKTSCTPTITTKQEETKANISNFEPEAIKPAAEKKDQTLLIPKQTIKEAEPTNNLPTAPQPQAFKASSEQLLTATIQSLNVAEPAENNLIPINSSLENYSIYSALHGLTKPLVIESVTMKETPPQQSIQLTGRG